MVLGRRILRNWQGYACHLVSGKLIIERLGEGIQSHSEYQNILWHFDGATVRSCNPMSSYNVAGKKLMKINCKGHFEKVGEYVFDYPFILYYLCILVS